MSAILTYSVATSIRWETGFITSSFVWTNITSFAFMQISLLVYWGSWHVAKTSCFVLSFFCSFSFKEIVYRSRSSLPVLLRARLWTSVHLGSSQFIGVGNIRILIFEFRILIFEFRNSNFYFWISSFGIWNLYFELRISNYELRISNFENPE